jgi:hypothetical protein
MNITQPTRLTFWQFIFAVSAAISLLSVYQLLGRAKALGVDLSASTAWMGLLTGLGLLGLFALLLLVSTGFRYRERILSLAESAERAHDQLRPMGALLFSLAAVGFTLIFMLPFVQSFFGGVGWIRVLVFWFFSLLGMCGIKLLRRETPWFSAWIATVLCQTTLHLLLLYWPRVTDYPFALGWSETSRVYYKSLILGEKNYCEE